MNDASTVRTIWTFELMPWPEIKHIVNDVYMLFQSFQHDSKVVGSAVSHVEK